MRILGLSGGMPWQAVWAELVEELLIFSAGPL
jgi:hypothetical protein